MGDGPFECIPRKPEETVLYGVVAEELETFLARRREHEHPVPTFVEREFRDYLTCGILEHGFIRVRAIPVVTTAPFLTRASEETTRWAAGLSVETSLVFT